MPNLPIVFIACRVFEQLLARHIPAELKDRVTFLDYGLHASPKNLRKTLQAEIDSITTPSLIVLGYGMCGNGLKDIQSGIHTLLMPKTDDCIAIFLGSESSTPTLEPTISQAAGSRRGLIHSKSMKNMSRSTVRKPPTLS